MAFEYPADFVARPETATTAWPPVNPQSALEFNPASNRSVLRRDGAPIRYRKFE